MEAARNSVAEGDCHSVDSDGKEAEEQGKDGGTQSAWQARVKDLGGRAVQGHESDPETQAARAVPERDS